ncbi:MAG: hypothetical protein LBC88_03885 [Spirochaetaceae bacterium]|jgi:hypothetical protein|nr:hypothetical protein [Spirochaetaceae bacterium]
MEHPQKQRFFRRNSRPERSLFFCLFVFLTVFPLEAQFFHPFTALRTTRTEHFDIIYPEASAETARAVAGFADGLYERISGELGITVPGRIPVAITPHTDLFNSVEIHLPYPHIIIFDTPLHPEWTVFSNTLENLFLHELVHAISLSSRNRFFRGLHRLFGGWVYPAAFNTPRFMSEGIAVMMESRDGTGRANDPLYRQYLFQMALENKFLSPFQASGVWEYPPGGNSYYWYGGLFSAWLEKTSGIEKYVELWRAMGGGSTFSLFFLRAGFYRHFERVYGRPFAEAWHEFKQSLWITGVRENPEPAVFGSPRPRLQIEGIASAGSMVYVLDSLSGKVFRHDTQTSRTGAAFTVDATAYHLAVRADGRAALVSAYRLESPSGFLSRAVVTEHRTAGGRTGRQWEHLYYADYFRDGVIGISSRGHRSALVFRPGNGRKKETEEVLLQGSAELVFANPSALDERRIVFIAARAGKRELCLYDYETRAVYTVAAGGAADEAYWHHLRGLRVSNGRVLFSYNHDGRMYKLGAAILPGNDESGSVTFATEDFSGGVFLPVEADGKFYYRGAFAFRDALMRYPGPAEELPGISTPLRLAPWSETEHEAARPVPPGAPGTAGAEAPLPASKPYTGLGYFNPLRFWLPVPLVRPESGGLIDGAGILTVMTDPIGNNSLMITASFDVRSLAGVFDVQWTNNALGLPLTFVFSDTIDKTLEPFHRRVTSASLAAAFATGIGGEAVRAAIRPRAAVKLLAPDPGDNSHPYSWNYETPYWIFSLTAEAGNLRKHAWETFGTGILAGGSGTYILKSDRIFDPRVEGIFSASVELPLFPLRARMYGIWDKNLITISGASPVIATTSLFSELAASEYRSGAVFEWLAGGEAETGLFSLAIKKSISHVYLNRVTGTLAYRGTVYHDDSITTPGTPLGGGFNLAQSLVFRLSLAVSSAIVPLSPFSVSFTGIGIWRISGLIKNGIQVEDLRLGFLWSLRL